MRNKNANHMAEPDLTKNELALQIMNLNILKDGKYAQSPLLPTWQAYLVPIMTDMASMPTP